MKPGTFRVIARTVVVAAEGAMVHVAEAVVINRNVTTADASDTLLVNAVMEAGTVVGVAEVEADMAVGAAVAMIVVTVMIVVAVAAVVIAAASIAGRPGIFRVNVPKVAGAVDVVEAEVVEVAIATTVASPVI